MRTEKSIPRIQGLYMVARRWFLVTFKPRYVMRKQSARRSIKVSGQCEDCDCCERVARGICKHFTPNRKCAVMMKTGKLPFWCDLFPLDEKDQKLMGVKDSCNFYWAGKKIK